MIIHRPQTATEAVQIRYANPDTTAYLAGGTDDLRLGGAAGGKELIDINALGLNTIEEKNGKKKVVLRKILPCYVFIKMVYSNDMWFLITNSRGVTGFVGPQGKAIPLGEDEVKKMRLEERVESCDLQIGDSVRIISGALASFIGIVEDLNMDTQKAKVKVSMFGRETEVDVDFIQLDKLGAEQ